MKSAQSEHSRVSRAAIGKTVKTSTNHGTFQPYNRMCMWTHDHWYIHAYEFRASTPFLQVYDTVHRQYTPVHKNFCANFQPVRGYRTCTTPLVQRMYTSVSTNFPPVRYYGVSTTPLIAVTHPHVGGFLASRIKTPVRGHAREDTSWSHQVRSHVASQGGAQVILGCTPRQFTHCNAFVVLIIVLHHEVYNTPQWDL
jgi:hypothetical protein